MHYYILVDSKKHARLFEVQGDSIAPVDVEDMPKSLADAWKGLERDQSNMQSHTTSAGGGTVAFHGTGAAKDVSEEEEDHYAHALAKSLQPLLAAKKIPLVFAGVTEAFGMFRTFDTSKLVLDEYIRGNPDDMKMEDLKEKADPIVHAHMSKQNEIYTEQYGNLMGTGRTSIDPAQILESGKNGKIELLLIAEGTEDMHQDLVSHTEEHRGRVVALEAAKMPEGAEVAAILRL